jgi:drug/metabolite transporter (DMT)-like permease
LLDFLLLLMVVIWGSNFAVVKSALADFPSLVFNALRLAIASALFLVAIAVQRRRAESSRVPLTFTDWRQLAQLGIVGHFVYQLLFVAGLARTTVGNAALIFGCTPVTVSVLSSLSGHERIPPPRWFGLALSVIGIYAVVGHRTSWSMDNVGGDLILLVAMGCWSLYSVMSKPLLERHSALVVTGWSMTIGTVLYLMLAAPAFLAIEWPAISTRSWWLMLWSAVFSMALAYVIWYTAIQRIGSSRTSMYSNLTPIIGMIIGAVWMDEATTGSQVVGAAAIVTGVFVARIRT